jgi:hypothetical protein
VKTQNLTKFESDTGCIVHAVLFFYITITFWDNKKDLSVVILDVNCLALKRKFLFASFRENFFTKIDDNSGNIYEVDYTGNGASD